MSSGIRAEVRIESPADCPVARTSGAADAASYSITKSVDPTDPDVVTEEFLLGARPDPDDLDVDTPLEDVFSYGSKAVYRFERDLGRGCACECIERFDCPVIDLHAEDGALHLVFHAPDMETLQGAMGALRERYPGLDVQRLLRSREGEAGEEKLVFVDRSRLTARQREVLETAHGMGYFDHPKRANAGEVADELGITTSTLTEHLSAAQRKLLGAILDG